MPLADFRASALRPRALHGLLAGVLSGIAFVVIFARWAPLPKEAYSYRDDAVITLSHARNLVDYGAIGVDPAGARVEGFSAPLQFWVFVVAYAATHCGYARFLDMQVPIATFALGFVVVQLFRPRYLVGLLLSAAVALWLTTCVRFFGWHSSGMENAYTHALFIATLACCVYSIDRRSVKPYMVATALLASLVRIESILHIAPLLVIWSVCYRREHRRYDAAIASVVVLLGWAAYQGFRVAYFGDWRPNTAVAEGVDFAAFLRQLAQGHVPRHDGALSAIKQIAGEHRAFLALLAVPLLVIGTERTSRTALVLMLVSLCATGILHPMLFGPARLDPVRTTSHVALVAPLLVTTQWAQIARWPARVLSLAALGCTLALYLAFEPPADTFFCCPIVRADPIADACVAHAKSERIHLPSLANPDLGKVSFRKQFLLFDLGQLGSPPIAAFKGDHVATASYLLDFAAPDYIEMHGAWVCEYGYLQHDPRFVASYVPVPGTQHIGLSTGCRQSGNAGLWFRKSMAASSTDPERRLHDDLARTLAPERVSAELRSCKLQPGRLACAYVARTLYRFIPELVRSHQLPTFRALLLASPSSAYDTSLLDARSDGTWHRRVVSFVRDQLKTRTGNEP